MRKGLILLLMMCCLSGCASLVTVQPAIRTLPVVTNPEGADIYVVDVRSGKLVTDINAKTPYALIVDRDDGYFRRKNYEVRLTMKGYIPEKMELKPGLNSWYFGNIFLGIVPGMLVIDPLTGAMWNYNIDQISVKMFPETPEGIASREQYLKEKRD